MPSIIPDEVLDTYGMLCPLPIVKTAEKMRSMSSGDTLKVISSDAAIQVDMPNWCKSVGNEYLGFEEVEGAFHVYVRKSAN
ncbi:MAG: sulfurtransferase TusA family protein [bacterium]